MAASALQSLGDQLPFAACWASVPRTVFHFPLTACRAILPAVASHSQLMKAKGAIRKSGAIPARPRHCERPAERRRFRPRRCVPTRATGTGLTGTGKAGALPRARRPVPLAPACNHPRGRGVGRRNTADEPTGSFLVATRFHPAWRRVSCFGASSASFRAGFASPSHWRCWRAHVLRHRLRRKSAAA